MSCQAAASTLNINVSHQKRREKKNPYACQGIAQKMLAYRTQHLDKSEQKKCDGLTKMYIYSIGLHIVSVSYCLSEEL